MSEFFSPYSKEQQLRGHQKSKDKPKPKEKRPKKRKRKLETFKGRTIPPARQRSSISKKEYNRAIETFGSECVYCGNPRVEMHHIKYRSQQGRGGYRNLIPLCKEHHNQAHQQRAFADKLKENRILLYGEWYWADKFDLFKAGLIDNTTDEAFESYMTMEEEKCREMNGTSGKEK